MVSMQRCVLLQDGSLYFGNPDAFDSAELWLNIIQAYVYTRFMNELLSVSVTYN